MKHARTSLRRLREHRYGIVVSTPPDAHETSRLSGTVSNVGRLPVIATLEDLDEASLKLILTEPKNALVKQYQRLFEMEGAKLSVAAEALGAIARKAIDRKTGRAGYAPSWRPYSLNSMLELPSLEGVKEIVISQQVVEGTAGPLYMYGGGMRAS